MIVNASVKKHALMIDQWTGHLFIPGKGGIGFNSKCRGESQVINDQRLETPQDISNYFWTCKVVQSRHRFMEDDFLTCYMKVAPTLGVTSS